MNKWIGIGIATIIGFEIILIWATQEKWYCRLDEERRVFGEGENPLTVDLEPEYALRIARAIETATREAMDSGRS
jgi:hypothetical protein